MGYVTLNVDKLKQNYNYLDTLFKRNGIDWSIVTKLLCGNETYIDAVINLGVKQVCDSRIANLKMIKTKYPEIETIFIKPPAKRNASKVVEHADISFNTSLETVKALSRAAMLKGKMHKIVIMVELGELREGVLLSDLVQFYGDVSELPNIEVIGLGTNLTCMYGVLPSYEKLEKLEIYKKTIEAEYDTTIPILSGGASVTIPLIQKGELPEGINHFRIGETLFLGTDVYNNTTIEGMHQHIFTLHGEIIELEKKPNIPYGELGHNLTGEKKEFDDLDPGESYRAIIDIGMLDIDTHHVQLIDDSITIVGASSDMTVLDLGKNEQGYKTGDKIQFTMDYMGTLRIMHSRYIEKRMESFTTKFIADNLSVTLN